MNNVHNIQHSMHDVSKWLQKFQKVIFGKNYSKWINEKSYEVPVFVLLVMQRKRKKVQKNAVSIAIVHGILWPATREACRSSYARTCSWWLRYVVRHTYTAPPSLDANKTFPRINACPERCGEKNGAWMGINGGTFGGHRSPFLCL